MKWFYLGLYLALGFAFGWIFSWAFPAVYQYGNVFDKFITWTYCICLVAVWVAMGKEIWSEFN